eukprot:748897-Hanusia_phi.AAC.1
MSQSEAGEGDLIPREEGAGVGVEASVDGPEVVAIQDLSCPLVPDRLSPCACPDHKLTVPASSRRHRRGEETL